MRTTFLLLLLVSAFTGIQAQDNTIQTEPGSSDLLVGKWDFSGFVVNGADEDANDKLERMFKDMTISFTEDGKYQGYILSTKDDGTYTVENNVISLSSIKGDKAQLGIIELDEEKFAFDLQGAKIRMKRGTVEVVREVVKEK